MGQFTEFILSMYSTSSQDKEDKQSQMFALNCMMLYNVFLNTFLCSYKRSKHWKDLLEVFGLPV